jgi:adenosylcobinamide-GDP ribazoletransferase
MLSAFAFLTVVGPPRTPDRTTLLWFPIVGAAIGAILGGIWWATDELFGAAVAAGLVIAADLLLTGALHFDGLADAADGLLPHADRSRRLEIMSDPHIGAFALAVVPTVLLLRWAALWSQPVEPLVLVGLWTISRSLMAAAPALIPYARDAGLASPFIAGSRWWIALAAIPATVLLIIASGGDGGVAAAGTMLTMAAVLALARSRVGGFTGDVLGAAAVLGETVGLILTVPR